MCKCNPMIKSIYCLKCDPRGATAYQNDIDKANKRPIIDKVVEAVRTDLLNRSNVGIAKYGTTLDKNNGNMRYWINHAYEECLDQANYLKRLLMEIDNENNS